MKNLLTRIITPTLLFTCSLLVTAADLTELKQGFIIDNLSTFMHTGPGTNYRILGTVNAGSTIKITGLVEKDYNEIIDDKGRKAWVESKYVTEVPGLRLLATKLSGQLSKATDLANQLDGEVNALKNAAIKTQKKHAQLKNEIKELKGNLLKTTSKLKGQDSSIKKQWFIYGAGVLGTGLILGIIIPMLFGRRRSNMDSWQ